MELATALSCELPSMVVGNMGTAVTAMLSANRTRSDPDFVIEKPIQKTVLLAAIQRALRRRSGEDFKNPISRIAAPLPPALTRKAATWNHVQAVLAGVGGNKSAAARILGMNRASLQRFLKRGPPK